MKHDESKIKLLLTETNTMIHKIQR